MRTTFSLFSRRTRKQQPISLVGRGQQHTVFIYARDISKSSELERISNGRVYYFSTPLRFNYLFGRRTDDSLGMSLRQRLSGHRVLLMNVIPLRAAPQNGTRGIRQCGYSTLVGFVANTRRFRLHRGPREGLIPLLLIVLWRLVQVHSGLPHLCRVSEHKHAAVSDDFFSHRTIRFSLSCFFFFLSHVLVYKM